MLLSVRYTRKGDVQTIDTGGPLGRLVIDNSKIPEENRGGIAKQLLGSAALYCYCAALGAALKSRGVAFDGIEAEAVLDVDHNDKGQSRVLKIGIHSTVGLSEDDADTFERVMKIMKQGCLVTGSLHDGIQIEYELKPEYRED